MGSEESKKESPVTIAEAVQNIVIVAMANGWLAVLLGPFFFLAIFGMVPNSDKLKLLENIASSGLIIFGGWVFSCLLILGWYMHIKWVREKYETELERQVEEKTALQAQLVHTGKLKSSKGKK